MSLYKRKRERERRKVTVVHWTKTHFFFFDVPGVKRLRRRGGHRCNAPLHISLSVCPCALCLSVCDWDQRLPRRAEIRYGQ